MNMMHKTRRRVGSAGLAAALGVALVATGWTRSLRMVEFDGKIIAVQRNGRSPVETFRLTVEVPCTAVFRRTIKKRVGNKLFLGVQLASSHPNAPCQAMPALEIHDAEVKGTFVDESDIDLRNAVPGLRIVTAPGL